MHGGSEGRGGWLRLGSLSSGLREERLFGCLCVSLLTHVCPLRSCCSACGGVRAVLCFDSRGQRHRAAPRTAGQDLTAEGLGTHNSSGTRIYSRSLSVCLRS